MKIGDVAGATRTQVATIRFYEREGLLPVPKRSGSNYRVYGDAHVERLSFIRHCRALDMSLDEIRVLLHAKDSPGRTCDEVNALLDIHIEQVGKRIRDLRVLDRELRALRDLCGAGRAADQCGILNELSNASQLALAGRGPLPNR